VKEEGEEGGKVVARGKKEGEIGVFWQKGLKNLKRSAILIMAY